MITPARRVAGITCPRCKQFCYELSDGTISFHQTDQYVPGQSHRGRRKENCPYGGGTRKDAKNKITPLRRRILDGES